MTRPDDPEGDETPGSGFHSIRGGGAAARFAAPEAMLLRDLVRQVAELVSGEELAGPGEGEQAGKGQDAGAGGEASDGTAGDAGKLEEMFALSDSAALPDDPVLARLLPDAYADDLAAAGEFRRYTESGLRSGKVAAARTVLGTLPENGGKVRLSADEAQAWLRAINDIRLALGVRLNITEDRDAMLEEAAQGGPQAAGLWIYDWLTLIQETLVEALW
jgi:hypothetical protein